MVIFHLLFKDVLDPYFLLRILESLQLAELVGFGEELVVLLHALLVL
jgi:hypothetical protein